VSQTLPLTLSQLTAPEPAQPPDPTNVFTNQGLPGYVQSPHLDTPIPTSSDTAKEQTQAQQTVVQVSTVPTQTVSSLREKAHATGITSLRMGPRVVQETQTFLYNFIGGGDFEDPAWTQIWQYVWLGSGLPVRTNNPSLVINGNYSMWLGGTPLEDAVFYPVAFPESIDTSQQSYLRFNLAIYDQDIGYDSFCVALIDESGNFIGPYATSGADCAGANGAYTYQMNLSGPDLAALAGHSGYVALYMAANGVAPHTSAFIDDVVFALDLPNPTATSTPPSGPAGSKFLVTGKYDIPYGSVDVCVQPCSTPGNYITTVYADARGSIAAFLKTSNDAAPGVYGLQTRDIAGRLANTSFTVVGGVSASLSVTPTTGVQGTTFAFAGQGFLPNDSTISVSLNGQPLGTVGSNAQGQVVFTLSTQSNTPAGSYAVKLTDGAGRTASATFTLTALAGDQPRLVVSPASAAPGASFVFTATGFTPNTPATVALESETLGQVNINSSGSAVLTLQTQSSIPPGRYTLIVAQGSKQASASFEIIGGSGPSPTPITGNGLYVTLVWTDPPAQASATKTLVNDLDLSVTGPGGVNALGNGGSSADRMNNVEAIRLENPPAGFYVITVRAQAVNAAYGAQPFALAATTRQNFGSSGGDQTLIPPGGPKKLIYVPLVMK
jgi:hypothetical protein